MKEYFFQKSKTKQNDVCIQKVEKTTGSKDERSDVWRHQRASKKPQNWAVNSRAATAFPGDSGENLAWFSHSSSLVSASPRSSSVSRLSLTKCFALSSKRRSVWIGGSCLTLSFRFDCRWGSYCGRTTCTLTLHVWVPSFACSMFCYLVIFGFWRAHCFGRLMTPKYQTYTPHETHPSAVRLLFLFYFMLKSW